MTEVRVNGVPRKSLLSGPAVGISPDRLRTIVQDCHLNFLIGAGTPSAYFGVLGNIEDALSQLAESTADEGVKAIVRASIQAHFFDSVLAPNLEVIERDASTEEVLTSYAKFLQTLNRILLKRHSSILAKQVNVFTTNVDMVFEVAFEQMGIDFSDGFSGKIRPRFDLGDFSTIRFRLASRFEQRSEVPVFNLVKMHGSAGWLQEERSAGKVEIIFDHGLSLVTETKAALNAARADLITIASRDDLDTDALIAKSPPGAVPATVTSFSESYAKLGIVNPDKQKFATTVLNETYYELIRRFANELEKENSALFVHGFSFRDEHLRDVAVRAARSNPTLQVIVFCYSRGDLANYQKLIPDTDIKNGNIQFVLPPEPGEDEDERVATLDVVTSAYFEPIIADKFPEAAQRIELDIRVPSEEGTGV
ncbi:MAG: SIR2 family protein [Candidatus Nanopelagicales bacterium]|nr:SIR2 family protein [Candidatus Nanopelagicales bacterium]